MSCTSLLSSFGILIFIRSHSGRDEKISTPGPTRYVGIVASLTLSAFDGWQMADEL